MRSKGRSVALQSALIFVLAIAGLFSASYSAARNRGVSATLELGPIEGWVAGTSMEQQGNYRVQLLKHSGNLVYDIGTGVNDPKWVKPSQASRVEVSTTIPSALEYLGDLHPFGGTTVVKGGVVTTTMTELPQNGTRAGGRWAFKFKPDTPLSLTSITFKVKIVVTKKRGGTITLQGDDVYPVAALAVNLQSAPAAAVRPGQRIRVELSTTLPAGHNITLQSTAVFPQQGTKVVANSAVPPADPSPGGSVIWSFQDGNPRNLRVDLEVLPADQLPDTLNEIVLRYSFACTIHRTEQDQGRTIERDYNLSTPVLEKRLTLNRAGVRLAFTTDTVRPGETREGETVSYALKADVDEEAETLKLENTLPPDTTLVPNSVSPRVTPRDGVLSWSFRNVKTATVRFKLKIKPQKPEVLFITNRAHAEATLTSGSETSADEVNELRYVQAETELTAADANLRYLNGLFLPNAANAELLPNLDWSATRAVKGAAADGVTLLLLRAKFKAKRHGKVRFSIADDPLKAPKGSLWQTNAIGLVDLTPAGGIRDILPEGPDTVSVDSQKLPGSADEKVAFALYRTPRDFDAGAATQALQARPLKLKLELLNEDNDGSIGEDELDLEICRPLVMLQHGTFDTPAGWAKSPLHTDSANETKGYTGGTAAFPFQTDRPDFGRISAAAGPLSGNATAARVSALAILENWRQTTGFAGSQFDVVCHSQGGVVWRWIAQTQSEPNYVTLDTSVSYRNGGNWGHGMLHKLITIATTHRGSAIGNHTAYLNHNGRIKGMIRYIAEYQGAPIDAGGVEDQMVVAPMLRQIRETRVPSHALAGSGLPEYNPMYAKRLLSLWASDTDDGPYRRPGFLFDERGNPLWDVFRQVANYGFNLNYSQIQDDKTQDPNYDLTVSAYSSKGKIARRAVSDPRDIELFSGLTEGSLNGRLTHGDEIFPGAGDPVPVQAVANRVAFLLRQPVKSQLFAYFPAVADGGLTPTETKFSDHRQFNPAWLYEKSAVESLPNRSLAATPALVADPSVTDVSAGDEIEVTVSWPGKTIREAVLSWPGGQAGEPGIAFLSPPGLSTIVKVPARRPGAFPIGAFVQATDGQVGTVDLKLEIVADGPYSALRSQPNALRIRDTGPAALSLYGRRGVEWQEISHSKHLTLQSSDTRVVTIDQRGQVQPTGFGSATVTARYGSLSVAVPIAVTGEPISVAINPKKKGKLSRRSAKPAEFVFLSGPAFNPALVDRKSVLIQGLPPTGYREFDYNRDGVPDVAALLAPRALGLARGAVRVPVRGALTSGTLLDGLAIGTAK